mmetsp:Transcript_16495/g.36442  ORF Transcript_16495/g.36442 Transcript_16495/m.36442 type:complete len:134 (+) Transcript_16495:103-504(+)
MRSFLLLLASAYAQVVPPATSSAQVLSMMRSLVLANTEQVNAIRSLQLQVKPLQKGVQSRHLEAKACEKQLKDDTAQDQTFTSNRNYFMTVSGASLLEVAETHEGAAELDAALEELQEHTLEFQNLARSFYGA